MVGQRLVWVHTRIAGESAFDNRGQPVAEQTPQNLKEYDPEWARAFYTGSVSASTPHDEMLSSVKVSVLMSHHGRRIYKKSGMLIGAISDLQAQQVARIVKSAGQSFTYVSLPDAAHCMHRSEPDRYAKVLLDWRATVLNQKQ